MTFKNFKYVGTPVPLIFSTAKYCTHWDVLPCHDISFKIDHKCLFLSNVSHTLRTSQSTQQQLLLHATRPVRHALLGLIA